jgi:hypothetical protein
MRVRKGVAKVKAPALSSFRRPGEIGASMVPFSRASELRSVP